MFGGDVIGVAQIMEELSRIKIRCTSVEIDQRSARSLTPRNVAVVTKTENLITKNCRLTIRETRLLNKLNQCRFSTCNFA
ncbi:hypothetical protein TNCV_4966891 [Trichonephila clavipes]|nr:hypothetical protein TNCV_4966891 [Trichonephila clavipes]